MIKLVLDAAREKMGYCSMCERPRMSYKQAERESGVSRFVLKRFVSGKGGKLRVENFLVIAKWAGVAV